MTRETSIEAYNAIRDGNLLSPMRFLAYDLLFQNGPMTAGELYAKAKERAPQSRTPDYLHQRLSELRDRGVVREIEQRPCTVTGHTAVVWAVTGEKPCSPRRSSEKEIRYLCKMCGRSWPQMIEAKVQKAPTIHYDNEGQYCFGELKRFKEM